MILKIARRYFATIENSKGEKNTVWAKDLERTLKEQNIIKNDDIVLTYKGSSKVEVNTKEIDPASTGSMLIWKRVQLKQIKESGKLKV